jgi:hypothetical protein
MKRFRYALFLLAALMEPAFSQRGPRVEIVREIALGEGPGEIGGNDLQMAASAVYYAGGDRLLVADNPNHRINSYRLDGAFSGEYADPEYRFAWLRAFIVHDGYLILFIGSRIFFFDIDDLHLVLAVPVPHPLPSFDHTFDPTRDVVFVKNLMICRTYVDVIGLRMERIQAPPGLRCALGGYPFINAVFGEWNRQGADFRLDDQRHAYENGRILTRELSEFHGYLSRTVGADRLNEESGWNRWSAAEPPWGRYFGKDGLGNAYWTASGAIIVTNGDKFLAMTDKIEGYGYSLPAVTESGDVYFIGTVSDPDPAAVPRITGYRLLRVRNARDPDASAVGWMERHRF